MDVCDDLDYSEKCKALDAAAKEAGIAAVTTCGIYPGLSNVMASALVRKTKEAGYVVYVETHSFAHTHTHTRTYIYNLG